MKSEIGEWMIICTSSINDELSLMNHDVIASLWCWFWTIILLAALTFDNWMVNSEGKESMCISGAKYTGLFQTINPFRYAMECTRLCAMIVYD